jgi:regulator of cell morphogenesis and NO signaling
MFDITTATVKDLVTEDHRAAAVFEKYSIDFCCNGRKTIGAACAELGVDPAVVVDELQNLGEVRGGNLFRPAEWELDALIDFIVNNHHRYVRRMIPVLTAHVDKIVSVHGANHPELAGIAGNVHAVVEELRQHMEKEEGVLFPFIRAMVSAGREGRAIVPPPFGTLRNPIRMMEMEHQAAGDALFSIRRASGGYAPPSDACTTYRVTYRELEEFERDLHQHVHLENNILFPKSIELEARLLGRG